MLAIRRCGRCTFSGLALLAEGHCGVAHGAALCAVTCAGCTHAPTAAPFACHEVLAAGSAFVDVYGPDVCGPLFRDETGAGCDGTLGDFCNRTCTGCLITLAPSTRSPTGALTTPEPTPEPSLEPTTPELTTPEPTCGSPHCTICDYRPAEDGPAADCRQCQNHRALYQGTCVTAVDCIAMDNTVNGTLPVGRTCVSATSATSEPTSSETTTSEPTTSMPATSEPTTSEPTTSQPTTSEPTTSVPTTSEPTTSEPTTSVPTTAATLTGSPSAARVPPPVPTVAICVEEDTAACATVLRPCVATSVGPACLCPGANGWLTSRAATAAAAAACDVTGLVPVCDLGPCTDGAVCTPQPLMVSGFTCGMGATASPSTATGSDEATANPSASPGEVVEIGGGGDAQSSSSSGSDSDAGPPVWVIVVILLLVLLIGALLFVLAKRKQGQSRSGQPAMYNPTYAPGVGTTAAAPRGLVMVTGNAPIRPSGAHVNRLYAAVDVPAPQEAMYSELDAAVSAYPDESIVALEATYMPVILAGDAVDADVDAAEQGRASLQNHVYQAAATPPRGMGPDVDL